MRTNKGIAMRDSQLEKMSLKELLALDTEIKATIDEKRVSERAEMRAKMEDMARASGFSVAELFGGRKKGGKGVVKYRNPKDPSKTWTGRGRRPNWIVEAGGDPKKFLIGS
jgi:DNA-binding protein H-NS